MVSGRELKDVTHGLARLHVIPAQRPVVAMRHLRAGSTHWLRPNPSRCRVLAVARELACRWLVAGRDGENGGPVRGMLWEMAQPQHASKDGEG